MFDGKFPWNLWNTGENIFWKQAMHTSSHDLKKAKRQTSHRIEWSNSSNQRPVWLWSITMLPQVPSLVHEGVKWCENSRKQSFHLTRVDMSSDSLKAASICRLDSYTTLVGVNFRLRRHQSRGHGSGKLQLGACNALSKNDGSGPVCMWVQVVGSCHKPEIDCFCMTCFDIRCFSLLLPRLLCSGLQLRWRPVALFQCYWAQSQEQSSPEVSTQISQKEVKEEKIASFCSQQHLDQQQ